MNLKAELENHLKNSERANQLSKEVIELMAQLPSPDALLKATLLLIEGIELGVEYLDDESPIAAKHNLELKLEQATELVCGK